MITRMSEWLSVKLSEGTDNADKQDEIRYGIEIVFSALITPIVLFFVAFILDLFYLCVVVSITFAIFRAVMGGFHFSSYWRCLTVTLVSMLGAAAIVENYSDLFYPVMIVFLVVTLIIGMWYAIKYVPDNQTYRTNTNEQKYFLKRIAIGLVCLWFLICFVFYLNHIFLDFVFATICGLILQLASMTKQVGPFLNRLDKFKIGSE